MVSALAWKPVKKNPQTLGCIFRGGVGQALTWPGVLSALLVHHLFDSAAEQHARRVMVEGLQGLAGAVGLLRGHAAGSLLALGRRGCVAALPILVSLAVPLALPLALGQRAERPLLPHPFHAARMLGFPAPSPLFVADALPRRSLLDYFTPPPPPAPPG